MFERFTGEARRVAVHAQQHARRLGHRHVGPEHVLLAAASSGQPAGSVLREHGVTPDRVEEEIVRLLGLGAGAGLFADLDRDALASVGVDLDEVRTRVEAGFGPDALTRAGAAVQGGPSGRRSGLRAALRRRLRRRARQLVAATAAASAGGPAGATGRYRAPDPLPAGHIRFDRDARKVLERSVRAAAAGDGRQIGLEHLALGVLATDTGVAPVILAALGTSGPALRAAVLDRYRLAG